MKQIFCNNDFSFDYEQGVSYIELHKEDIFRTFYYNQEYTGKVEADFVDNTTFYQDKEVLVHLQGWMENGILQSVKGYVQFQDNTSIKAEHSLPAIIQSLDHIIQWRPYGKFI